MTPHANRLWIALTDRYDDGCPHVLCGTAYRGPYTAEKRGFRLYPRMRPLRCAAAALLAAILVSGCAAREGPFVPPAPVIMSAAACPAPDAPVLPPLDAALPLDGPDNVRALLERDDLCRRYIKGLQATIRCYESQSKEGK